MRCVISDAIEKVFVSFFYYLGFRRFASRVQVLPTAATQKTFKALPVRCSGESETPPGARGIRKFCDMHGRPVAIGHHPPRDFAVYVWHA